MELPKFMLADNSEFQDDVFILHTDFPRFVVNLVTEDIEWFDDVAGEDKDELADEVEKLVVDAERFYQEEIEKYQEEE
ncbi:MAG: hypothetical protein KAG96_07140 [Ichthyobacteriaceae bacterium]|nr:hypothetical protein [Ichthyobacteriaceae bacterium]